MKFFIIAVLLLIAVFGFYKGMMKLAELEIERIVKKNKEYWNDKN